MLYHSTHNPSCRVDLKQADDRAMVEAVPLP